MPYILGTDEAGYAPNLGPLVVSASLWEVPEDVPSDDLYAHLRAAIVPPRSNGTRKNNAGGGRHIVIGDSKALYHSGSGLDQLERGLWAALGLMGRRPATCGEVWALLAGEDAGPRREALCDGCDGHATPCDSDLADIDRLVPEWCGGWPRPACVWSICGAAGHFILASLTRPSARCDSKGTALSRLDASGSPRA